MKDLPNVRLSAKQGEEIHADEYSLKLFYATRICPMTLEEIKTRFPEPSPGKAQSVLDRYVDCDLVHKTEDGAYYSNYPDNYINCSNHKYDKAIEAQKDAKIFKIMKKHSGDKKYWETRSYFSIDSFFTEDQTQELQAMFKDIRYKAKQFAHRNAQNKRIDGLKFRRLKFYDMILSVLFFFIISIPTQKTFAGNDPTWPKWNNSTQFDFSKNQNDFNSEIAESEIHISSNDPTSPEQDDFTHFNDKKIVAANNAGHLFDVTFLETMKDYFETKTGETDEPIVMTLIEECGEFLYPGNGPNNWNLDCAEMLQEWVINECVNESQDACNILRSEGLIMEI